MANTAVLPGCQAAACDTRAWCHSVGLSHYGPCDERISLGVLHLPRPLWKLDHGRRIFAGVLPVVSHGGVALAAAVCSVIEVLCALFINLI